MSERTTLTCDVCGKDRAEVNGWWSYRTDEREFHAGHADGKKGRFHACGHLCIHKALDAYLTSQTVTTPIPEPPPQAEQEQPVKEETESLVRGKGLTVEELVEATGGNPEEAVFEGSVSVVIAGETRRVAAQDTLPCDPGEATVPPVVVLPVDNPQIEIPFEEKENQPGEPEKREK
jgi:hypothetical protein